MADYTFITAVDNLKQATAMLNLRAKRNLAQAAQSAQQNTQLVSQQQQQSAQVTGDEARKTLTTEYQLKMQLEELKGRNAVAAAEVQAKGHIDATELLQMYKAQQMMAQQAHQADMAGQGHDAAMAQHDAGLTSQEQQAQAQRDHEVEMQENEPQPQAA